MCGKNWVELTNGETVGICVRFTQMAASGRSAGEMSARSSASSGGISRKARVSDSPTPPIADCAEAVREAISETDGRASVTVVRESVTVVRESVTLVIAPSAALVRPSVTVVREPASVSGSGGSAGTAGRESGSSGSSRRDGEACRRWVGARCNVDDATSDKAQPGNRRTKRGSARGIARVVARFWFIHK